MDGILHRLGRALSDCKWALYHRFHPQHRYNVVHTGLRPGYYDPDTLMLHTWMALLKSFRECTHHEIIPEVEQVWAWWSEERPADRARAKQMLHELFGRYVATFVPVEGMPGLTQMVFPERSEAWEVRLAKYRALEQKIEDDEQKYLGVLLSIRQRLWL